MRLGSSGGSLSPPFKGRGRGGVCIVITHHCFRVLEKCAAKIRKKIIQTNNLVKFEIIQGNNPAKIEKIQRNNLLAQGKEALFMPKPRYPVVPSMGIRRLPYHAVQCHRSRYHDSVSLSYNYRNIRRLEVFCFFSKYYDSVRFPRRIHFLL